MLVLKGLVGLHGTVQLHLFFFFFFNVEYLNVLKEEILVENKNE